MKLMQGQALNLARIVDTGAANDQIENWRKDLGSQIDIARQKIAGVYDPAKAALAEWSLQNEDAVDKIVASGGTVAAVLSDVSRKFSLEAQAESAVKMRDMAKQARLELLGITNPFEGWKASLGAMPGVDPKAMKDLYDYQQKIQMVKDAAQGIRDTIVGAFNDAFEHGAKTFFSSVVQGFNKMLRDMAVQQLANRAMGALTGLIGGIVGGSGGGGGGFISKDLVPAAGISFQSIAGPAFSMPAIAGHRAGGGPVLPGGSYLVGEHGPEMFRAPGSGGTIVPNHMLAPESSQTYNVTVNVQSSGGDREMDRRSGQQAGQALLAEMQRSARRNG